ncbi:MAG: hypothetical protein HWN67_06180 [Candidatus Helarchaeota archaeon]|nr:hypothetical protein [Candidatus Helarchaeota archaeon]
MKNKKLIFIVTQILLISIISLTDPSSERNYFPFWKNMYPNSIIIAKRTAPLLWNNNGSAICTEGNNQQNPQICGDGSGGAIITWEDNRSGNWDIYAQKINSGGDSEWMAMGVIICVANNNQQNPRICSDGAGGAIIIWEDSRSGNWDIYAQKVNSSGEVEWDANGIVICNTSDNQRKPQICSDGTEGAIITWEDYRIGNWDIYAQNVNSSGYVEWAANGTVICNAGNNQQNPQICNADAGSAIITWQDNRNLGQDVYAQKVNSSGGVEWKANGQEICLEITNQRSIQICSVYTGGAIITWYDSRIDDDDIFAQKISSGGVIEWTFGGEVICEEYPELRNPQICSDGSGGAIIVWEVYEVGTGYLGIYVQKVNSSGGREWADTGVSICSKTTCRVPKICNADMGGAFITWRDFRNGMNDIYAQKINSSGGVDFIADGAVICNAISNQQNPQICSDGYKGAIITWEDNRSGNWDIYAQLIKGDGPPTSNHPENIITIPSGSDAIYWRLYDDYGEGKYRVWVNDTSDIYRVWINWTSWFNNTHILVPINYEFLGTFNYTIEYNDSLNQFSSDTVIVIIRNMKSKELPQIPIGIQEGGNIIDFLLSPFGLGIITGIIAVFIIMTTVLIKNNKIIKENNKTIKELQKKIGKIHGSRTNFKNSTKKKL